MYTINHAAGKTNYMFIMYDFTCLLHILTTEHKSENFKFIAADISTSYNNTK